MSSPLPSSPLRGAIALLGAGALLLALAYLLHEVLPGGFGVALGFFGLMLVLGTPSFVLRRRREIREAREEREREHEDGLTSASSPDPGTSFLLSLDPATLETSLEVMLSAIEHEHGVTVAREPELAKVVAQTRDAIGTRGAAGLAARRQLFTTIELLVGQAFKRTGDARRLARRVAVRGAPVRAAEFMVLTRDERDALRRRGEMAFAAWPSDALRTIGVKLACIGAASWVWNSLGPSMLEQLGGAVLLGAVWWGTDAWGRRRNVGLTAKADPLG